MHQRRSATHLQIRPCHRRICCMVPSFSRKTALRHRPSAPTRSAAATSSSYCGAALSPVTLRGISPATAIQATQTTHRSLPAHSSRSSTLSTKMSTASNASLPANTMLTSWYQAGSVFSELCPSNGPAISPRDLFTKYYGIYDALFFFFCFRWGSAPRLLPSPSVRDGSITINPYYREELFRSRYRSKFSINARPLYRCQR